MEITSPAFKTNTAIPGKYTCKGRNVNPPLRFMGIPPETQSLILTVEDIDATPKPRVHWFVFNIPAHVTAVNEGEAPMGGLEGFANEGKPGYEGPCPENKNSHRLEFTLYAMKATLEAPDYITKDDIEAILTEHKIGEARLIGLAQG